MSEKVVLIVKTGDALPSVKQRRGDYEDWIAAGLGRSIDQVVVASVFEGDELPKPDGIAGVVVTGSAAMVSAREDWSEATAAWLADVVRRNATPVLGLCYGHQLMAHGLGGEVGPNPKGREMGTVEVIFDEAPASGKQDGDGFGPLFERGVFPGHMSHVESVLTPPPGAQVLARTTLEPHAALRFGPRQWGVQFHPEFDRDILEGYVEARREILISEGQSPDELIAKLEESPALALVLERFAALVEEADG